MPAVAIRPYYQIGIHNPDERSGPTADAEGSPDGVEVQYQFICVHTEKFPIEALCRTFDVSRSGHYARIQPSAECTRSIDDECLVITIRRNHTEKRQRYGALRIWQELKRRGWRYSKKRVARLKHQHQVRVWQRRAWVRTTESQHALPVVRNVLDWQCDTRQPNQKRVNDITYAPPAEGWLYLAAVLNLFGC